MKKIIAVILIVLILGGIGTIGYVVISKDSEFVSSILEKIPFLKKEDKSKVKGVDYVLQPYDGTLGYAGLDTDALPEFNNEGYRIIYATIDFDGSTSYHDNTYTEILKLPDTSDYVVITAGKYKDSNGYKHVRGYTDDFRIYEIISDEYGSIVVTGVYNDDTLKFEVKYACIDGEITGELSYAPEYLETVPEIIQFEPEIEIGEEDENSSESSTDDAEKEGNSSESSIDDVGDIMEITLPRVEMYPRPVWKTLQGNVLLNDQTDMLMRQTKPTDVKATDRDFETRIYSNGYYKVTAEQFTVRSDGTTYMHLTYNSKFKYKLTDLYPLDQYLKSTSGDVVIESSSDDGSEVKVVINGVGYDNLYYEIGNRMILIEQQYNTALQRDNWFRSDADGGINKPLIAYTNRKSETFTFYEPGVKYILSDFLSNADSISFTLEAEKLQYFSEEIGIPAVIDITFSEKIERLALGEKKSFVIELPENVQEYYILQVNETKIFCITESTFVQLYSVAGKGSALQISALTGESKSFTVDGYTYKISAKAKENGEVDVRWIVNDEPWFTLESQAPKVVISDLVATTPSSDTETTYTVDYVFDRTHTGFSILLGTGLIVDVVNSEVTELTTEKDEEIINIILEGLRQQFK